VFELIDALVVARPRRLLELGAGTGDLTLRLARRVDALEAVEPSLAMLEIAGAKQAREGCPDNVQWIHAAAETYRYEGPYDAVVAAEALHWMSWGQVLPAIARSLKATGFLVIVCDRVLWNLPWRDRERELVARHSTNRDYRPYDLASELKARELFVELGRKQCCQLGFCQSVDDYVESFHSRNGFSRERMPTASDFDRKLRELVLASVPSGQVEATVVSNVIWGRPKV